MRGLLLIFLLAVAPPSVADDRQRRIDVEYDGRVIDIQIEADIRAPLANVRALMRDHKALPHFLPMVSRSDIVATRPDGAIRTRADLHACVLFVCRELRQVLDLRYEDSGGSAVTVPMLSDFRSGRVDWRTEDGPDTSSRLVLTARFEPRRTVPLVFGPWLVKRKIRREIEAGLQRLEGIAIGGYYASQPR